MTEEKKFTCALSSLDATRTFVEEFSLRHGVNASPVAELVLAVNEAVTNIIEHGRIENPDAVYSVEMEYNPAELSVTIRDGGREYDPNSLRTATSGNDIKKRRPRSGMGVYLIRQLVDGVIYHRNGGENVLKFVKNL